MSARIQSGRLLFATALLLVVALAACGGDDAGEPTTTGTPTTAPTETSATSGSPTTTAAPATTPAPPATTSTIVTTTTVAGPDHVFDVTVAAGEVTAPDRPDVAVGDEIRIVVTGDVSDEVHVHGYDLFAELTPDSPAEIEFVADIPGIFEVELEGSHALLMEFRVG